MASRPMMARRADELDAWHFAVAAVLRHLARWAINEH